MLLVVMLRPAPPPPRMVAPCSRRIMRIENCDGGNEVHYEDTPQHCNYQILAPIIRTHFRTLIGRGDIALRQDTPGGNTFSLGALPIDSAAFIQYVHLSMVHFGQPQRLMKSSNQNIVIKPSVCIPCLCTFAWITRRDIIGAARRSGDTKIRS